MPDLTPALWKGPSGHQLSDGTVLEKDVTIAFITQGEADSSDNWEPTTKAKAQKAESVAEPITADTEAKS